MTDYKKQAEDALSPDLPTTGEHPFVLARALLACAADLEQAEKERDEATALGARERKARKAAEELNADQVVRTRTNLEARVQSVEAERDRLAREHEWEMQVRLDAQVALAAITEALDLKLSDLGNGWREGVKVILARIEIIVDEANRLAAERDRLAAALERIGRSSSISLQAQMAREALNPGDGK